MSCSCTLPEHHFIFSVHQLSSPCFTVPSDTELEPENLGTKLPQPPRKHFLQFLNFHVNNPPPPHQTPPPEKHDPIAVVR